MSNFSTPLPFLQMGRLQPASCGEDDTPIRIGYFAGLVRGFVMVNPKNPLEGITLEMMLNQMVEHYGWDQLASEIRINCFARDPSVKSSLKFLRRTPWARAKVEALYLMYLREKEQLPKQE